MTLFEIEKLTKEFSDAREVLRARVQELEDEISSVKKRHLSGIRRAIEAAAAKNQTLSLAIADAPELFRRPKTVIFHGVKIGYQKQKGEIIWEDESQVIKLIKKHFPGDWETYVKVTEKVLKTSLATLPASDLKKLGVTVDDTGDEIVIRPTDSEIDKLINALLKDEELNKAA